MHRGGRSEKMRLVAEARWAILKKLADQITQGTKALEKRALSRERAMQEKGSRQVSGRSNAGSVGIRNVRYRVHAE